MKTGIIDYGGGNLRSVANALRALGQDPVIIASPEQLGDATHLLLPGQGEFGDTMRRLDERGLTPFLYDWIAAGRPYFGICVGYQILFDSSEESPRTAGLGLVPGRVRRFQDEPGLKIPHMGWNSATATRGDTAVWQGLGDDPYFYYIHSYFPEPAEPAIVVAESTHGSQCFAGAIERGNLFACQFHPEKSQEAGLHLMRNFLALPVAKPISHPNDLLHGVNLESVLRTVVDRYGWEEMARQIPIRCFMFDPTITSSLTFLRKTPWARKKLEDRYVYDAIRDRSTT